MDQEIKANRKSQSFLREAAVLSVANFAVKIISVVFKIPLTNILGESIGVFTAAYSIYAMLFMLSTSGLPVAVSKLVSSSNGKGRGGEAKRITFLAVLMFGLFGLLLMTAVLVFAPNIAEFTNHYESALAMQVIAPALFFICVSSALKGYFQGLHNMYPTAVAQFIEAFFKLFVGLWAVIYANRSGMSVSVQAAFAISGVTVGSVLGTIFMAVYTKFSKKNVVADWDKNIEKDKKLLKQIAVVAFPVTLTAATLYFSQFLDTVVIVKCLVVAGEKVENARVLFSAYTGLSVPVYDLFPASLIFPLGTSILPAVSGAIAVKKFRRAGELANQAIKISSVIAILCGVFLFVGGRSCIALIYGSEDWLAPMTLSNGQQLSALDAASVSLSILAVSMFFISVVSICNSLMNAYGVPDLALKTSLLGIVILTVSEIALLYSPVGIYGAPLGSLICYFAVMLMDLRIIKKHCGTELKFSSVFARPLLCGAVTLAVTFGVYKGMSAIWLKFSETSLDDRGAAFVILLVTGVVMVITYAVTSVFFKSVNESDIRLLPKGDYLADKLLKFGWI